MITIGVVLSNAYADYSAHIIRGLCSRAKEKENINLIFFPGVLQSDLCSSHAQEVKEYADTVQMADVLIISDQKILHKLLEQPEDSVFSNILEHIPYILLKDDAGHVLDQAIAIAQGQSFELEEHMEEDVFSESASRLRKRDHFERALEFAMKAHKGQVRKGSCIPYIVHPIETALIAMTLTRDQDIIIASLFHDIVEDTPYSVKDIEDAFGAHIAHLVQMESENKRKGQDAAQTWKIRKQEFIDSLDEKSKDEKIIALADKLSNMRATRQGYLKNDEKFWERFHQKDKKMHAWYYRTVADKLREFEDTDAWQELDRLIKDVFEE